ncbi:MAG: glucose-6-phosphate isomerase [Elusimicrobiota bacterium]
MSGTGIIGRLWSKDASLWKEEEAHKAVIENSLGWLRMPELMPARLKELSGFAEEVRKAGFSHIAVLGMGGSSLAPEVFRRSLSFKKGFPKLQVLDSTDPETVSALEKRADPVKTLYLVASKSGSTVEPNRMLDYFYAKVKKTKERTAGENFIAVTDPGSSLVDKAKKFGFRKAFLNFADIGGRFSALSYFGLVPAALAGADVKKILASANKMAEACRKDSADNPGLALGTWLAEHAAAGRDKLTLLLPPEIESLGLWLEQLLAESTGKEGKGVVPIAGEPHSAHYGEDRVFVHVDLKGSKDKKTAALAKRLADAGRPLQTLEMKDANDLGAEIFRWEIATAVLGQKLGINPFDQPNVQLAKEKAKSLMAGLKRDGSLPSVSANAEADGLSLSFSKASLVFFKKSSSSPIDSAIKSFLSSAKPADYVGLLSYLCSDGNYEKDIVELRTSLLNKTQLAIQAGYGPRYLHSTGQLHKGGPNSGLFILISRSDGPDFDIPGAGHSFGQLIRAQALGDFQALDDAGRRAVLIRITGDPSKALSRLNKAVKAAGKAALKA